MDRKNLKRRNILSENEIIERFKANARLKNLGFATMMMCLPAGAFYDGPYKMILLIAIFSAGTYLEMKYACPNCKYRFDPRTRPEKISFCPNCGIKLK